MFWLTFGKIEVAEGDLLEVEDQIFLDFEYNAGFTVGRIVPSRLIFDFCVYFTITGNSMKEYHFLAVGRFLLETLEGICPVLSLSND